jgi:hypothetical protein
MLSHPLAVRSARLRPEQIENKFLQAGFIRDDFLRSVALQCGIRHLLHLSPLVRAIELYQRRLERLAVGQVACAFAKRFDVRLP